MNATALTLISDDFCSRQAFYLERWTPPSLTPKTILRKAIEHGLQSADPGEAASNEAFRLATEIGIDTAESDLLGIAEHIASLADFITWLLRNDSLPWKRPEPIRLPSGSLWTSGAFLDQSERFLRYLALVDRWDGWTQTALENSWQVMGESSVYQVPINVIVVEIGALRKGRWSNPFTTAWRHPVAKTLRFLKRNGNSFGGAWETVWRERDSATREQWLDAMTEDGVLAERFHFYPVDVQKRTNIALAESKLSRICSTVKPPEPQLSQCFDKVRPCPFRSCCPSGLEPSQETGFIPTLDFRA